MPLINYDFATQKHIDKEIEAITVPCTINVKADLLNSALVSAFEGGSNYWIKSVEIAVEPTRPCIYMSDVPFFGGALRIVVKKSERDAIEGEIKLLTLETLQAGITLITQKWPHHAADLIKENGDATTGDVIVQAAIFGDIIFG